MPLPIKNYDPANPSVTSVNGAGVFVPSSPAILFEPAALHWMTADSDAAGAPARAALGLGLRLTVKPGATATIIPVSLGPGSHMTCRPLEDPVGDVVEHRLYVWVSDDDLKSLQAFDPAQGGAFDVSAARFVFGLSPAHQAGLVQKMQDHLTNQRMTARFKAGFEIPRDAAGDIGTPKPLDMTHQLQAWLNGDSAILYDFANGVARDAAELVSLQAGDTVTLYAEVAFRQREVEGEIWYRINPGFLLERLRGADPLGAAAYRAFAANVLDRISSGVVTVPSELALRSELTAVAGGSLSSIVLLPYGIVPAPLFSFITSDEIAVFGSGLKAAVTLDFIRSQPVLTRDSLRAFWNRHRFQAEVFGSNPLHEFETTEYAAQLAQQGTQRKGWYEVFHEAIQYGDYNHTFMDGSQGDSVVGGDVIRQFVPNGRPSHPDHPEFVGNRSLQLLRIWPLRYYFRLGPDTDTAQQFAITQDTIDCIRQEYAFHMDWKQEPTGLYYWQPHFAFGTQLAVADADTITTDANARVVPAMLSNAGRITVPARTDIRQLLPGDRARDPANVVPESLSVYFPFTMIADEIMDRLDEVRGFVLDNVVEMEAVVATAPGAPDPIPGSGLSPFLKALMRLFLDLRDLAPLPATTTTMGFLRELYFPTQSLPGVTSVDVKKRFDEAFAALGPATKRDPKLTVRCSSAWRPPEHNETIGNLINSNHQVGLAADVQPINAGPGKRNPLFIAALHDVAMRSFAHNPPLLDEALLELLTGSFLWASFDIGLATAGVAEVVQGGRKVYKQVLASGQTDLPDDNTPNLTGSKQPSQKAAQDLRTVFDALNGAGSAWPVPFPSFIQVYAFCLVEASHTHFTFKRGSSIAGI
jgi:hypothetical protein